MNLFERLLPRVGDTILGRFRLERELGRGGFGVVYLATQTSLNQTVALKVLLPHILSNQELVERFSREVAVARDLSHPNTIRILDFDRTAEGIPFYAMEYVTGASLVDELRERGAMPEARARHIVVQVLKSLAEAHAKGVIHRDLKPANIMLCEIYGEQDYVKVLDFGIAKALTGVDGHTTKTGMLLGSPPYMSPEQAKAIKDLDARSDLYSVGLILAECLTAIPVVQVGELGQVLALHLSQEPLPFAPRVLNSPLWTVISKATAKDRNERYLNAAEMRAHLLSIDLPEGFAPPVEYEASSSPMPSGHFGSPHQTPSGQYGSRGSGPSPLPGGATPSPTPFPDLQRGSTPQPSSGPQMFVAGKTLSSSGSKDKPHKARVSPLLLLLALLVAGGVAAVVIVGPGSGGGERQDAAERGDDGSPAADVGQTALSDAAQRDDLGPSAALDATPGEGTGRVAVVDTPETGPEPDPELQAVAAGTELARASLYGSVPELHLLELTGDRNVTVSIGGAVLGVTPQPIQVPNVHREVDVVFERAGYRSETRRLDLATTAPIAVNLRRERRTDTGEPTEPDTGPGETGPGENGPEIVIPEVTIH